MLFQNVPVSEKIVFMATKVKRDRYNLITKKQFFTKALTFYCARVIHQYQILKYIYIQFTTLEKKNFKNVAKKFFTIFFVLTVRFPYFSKVSHDIITSNLFVFS